jgi:hypothetical protein
MDVGPGHVRAAELRPVPQRHEERVQVAVVRVAGAPQPEVLDPVEVLLQVGDVDEPAPTQAVQLREVLERDALDVRADQLGERIEPRPARRDAEEAQIAVEQVPARSQRPATCRGR